MFQGWFRLLESSAKGPTLRLRDPTSWLPQGHEGEFTQPRSQIFAKPCTVKEYYFNWFPPYKKFLLSGTPGRSPASWSAPSPPSLAAQMHLGPHRICTMNREEGGRVIQPPDPEFCAKHDPSHPHRAVLKCPLEVASIVAQTLRRFNEGRLEIWPLAALVQMCCGRNGLSDGLIPTPKNHELFLFVNVLGRDSWTQIYWELQSSCQISHHSHDTFTLHSDQLITRMDLPREERNKEGHHRCLVVGAGTNPILLQFHFFGPPHFSSHSRKADTMSPCKKPRWGEQES